MSGRFVHSDDPIQHWVLYLTNVALPDGRWCPHDLKNHPLRVRRPAPDPPDLSGDALKAHGLSGVYDSLPDVAFEYEDGLAFVAS